MRKPLTHAQMLERWLGAPTVENLSRAMKGFMFPVPLLNTPGPIYVCDGEFYGAIQGGAFASLSDLISEATAGKKQVLYYQKVGVAGPAAGASQSLWRVGSLPPAGSNAAAAPGGTVFTRTSTGAMQQTDAASGDTLHFVTWTGSANTAQGNALMLYDYLWGVNINHATTANSISGVPTRYQTAALAPGNFISGVVTTALGATAHNITITYVDDVGNAAEAGAAMAVRASSAVNTLPFTQPVWRYNLNAGDLGVRNLTNIALSAASSGNVDWFIGHALAILPHVPSAFLPFIVDGINSAFNLERIYDGAALALMEMFKSATAATTYTGWITVVSG